MTSDDPEDRDLPKVTKQATYCLVKGMSSNQYDKHNYKQMVEHYSHLSIEQKQDPKALLSGYQELFGDTLGSLPGAPFKLVLKKNVEPFYPKACTISKALIK